MLDHRLRILQAAARVYARLGWRGATTRRIAEEAGVNEVTLFRQFGSKDALLDQAMQECVQAQPDTVLPTAPVDPGRELTAWARTHHTRIAERRELVRQLLSDAREHPDVADVVRHGPGVAAAQLREYVVRLRRDGWLRDGRASPGDVTAAVTMLMSALFADAMNRDLMPELYPQAVDRSVAGYVRIFLRALSVESPSAHGLPAPSGQPRAATPPLS